MGDRVLKTELVLGFFLCGYARRGKLRFGLIARYPHSLVKAALIHIGIGAAFVFMPMPSFYGDRP